MKSPKMFVFDLDGVITDTAKYHFEAWKMLASELGLDFTIEDNERLKGVSRIRSFEIILEINDAVNRFTSEEKEHYANKKNSYYVKLIDNVTPDDILEGIVPLLNKAKENNIKTSIASASRNAFSVLKNLGLLESFDYIADANKISNSKPHPEVFLDCAKALKIDASECIGFEDADAGIQAISAAKMFSVGINVVQESNDSILPDYSVKSTRALNFDEILSAYSNNIKVIYPYNAWEIIEENFDIENNYRNETIFALSNGYIGTRGTFEENYDFDIDTGLEGTFLNGFYESEKIRYGEFNYGFPDVSQTMLNVHNAKNVLIKLDDEEFDMTKGLIRKYKRVLKLKEGLLERNVTWVSPKGKEIEITFKRIVSLTNKHLMAIKCEVTPINFNGKIQITSQIDGDVFNHTADTNSLIDYGPYGRVLQPERVEAEGSFLSITSRTRNTKFLLCCASENKLLTNCDCNISNHKDQFASMVNYQLHATKNQTITFEKYISYVSSIDYDEVQIQEITDKELTEACKRGFDDIAKVQKAYVSDFFESSDIKIEGDVALQQGIRFNMFHLLQACGRDGKTGVGAKGITGEGYEGHNFWDTEMYMIQPFIHTSKDLAKNLLDFRYNTLDVARGRALELGHPHGALYPWRTINGKEASAYYPLGTAQYHVNADIAYAFHKYVEVTGDTDYLIEKAAEVYFETARVWLDVGDFIKERNDKFCIHCVTGPDEYTALVDNNCYTNLMARENLLYAYDTALWMKANRPEAYKELATRIELKDSELKLFKKAADQMYFPYDENLGVYGQDDTFLYRKPWDPNKIPEEKKSLLYKHYHPLFVFRHKMCKQADLMMAMYLLSHKFSKEEMKKNFDYYEDLTLNHSSLSTCIFGILSCDLGYYDKAYEYFIGTSRLDLDDYHKNVHTGIHAANLAGTWMNIVFGFAGMRIHGGSITFNPYIPKAWGSYSFNITFKNQVINITISHKQTMYKLTQGDELVIKHNDQELTLFNGQEAIVAENVKL